MDVTASIGIAVYPGDGVDGTELLRRADQAMYEAKTKGKNSCRFYSNSVNMQLQDK
ncbi:diguanylate cyclase [Paenibacillus solisilvae]|uniref:Diguanylate cyclase n=1 Tax=Paenibacillus solisilvae TaxID=2486751 RepID=A0ABW0W4I5_9BACL